MSIKLLFSNAKLDWYNRCSLLLCLVQNRFPLPNKLDVRQLAFFCLSRSLVSTNLAITVLHDNIRSKFRDAESQ